MYEIAQSNPYELSAGKFDVIITDECHRSIYNSDGYGQVLDQIDAVEVGLTATPTEKTKQRFDENRVVEYDYGEALADGHVVPYDAHKIRTKITMDGVEDENGEHHPAKDLGSTFSVPDTHKKAAETLYRNIETKTELTLIFAASDSHATAIVHDLRQAGPFADENPEFIQKITYNADNPSETLTKFKDPYSPPYIVVTVQKIEAGIDIRPLKNIVMLRPVKSPVLFNQMVGRGTRTYDDKEKFRLFDFVGVLEYFDDLPPFATMDYEGQKESESNSTDSETSNDFKIINEPDEVVLTEQYFQLEGTEGKVTGEEYRQQFILDIQERADEIHNALNSADSITDAKRRVLNILHKESKHYVPLHILQVFNNDYYFTSDLPNGLLLLNLINSLLYGYYPDFDDRIQYAERQLSDKYDLNDTEQQYLHGLTHIAAPPDGIEFDQLRHPPLSKIGGPGRAQEEFTSVGIEEFVNELRSLLSDPVNATIQEPGTHSYDLAEEFGISPDVAEELFNIIHESTEPTQYTSFKATFARDTVAGPNISNTYKEKNVLKPKDILSSVVAGVSNPGIGAVYAAISLVISGINHKEPLTRQEAFSYSIIWKLANEEVHNGVALDVATQAIYQASQKINNSYLQAVSKKDADRIVADLDEKGIINEEEMVDGIRIILKDEFNADWELEEYLSDGVFSNLTDH